MVWLKTFNSDTSVTSYTLQSDERLELLIDSKKNFSAFLIGQKPRREISGDIEVTFTSEIYGTQFFARWPGPVIPSVTTNMSYIRPPNVNGYQRNWQFTSPFDVLNFIANSNDFRVSGNRFISLGFPRDEIFNALGFDKPASKIDEVEKEVNKLSTELSSTTLDKESKWGKIKHEALDDAYRTRVKSILDDYLERFGN